MPDNVYPPTPPDPLAGREDEFGELAQDHSDLPPVEPPSAGFIVQLFLVPALIVTVVIGVYLMFGQLASGEADWRKQLTDVRSDNPHVRWRGALGLAQMLQADVNADGVRLAENPEIATELAKLLSESLNSATTREDDFKQQLYLTRALGLIDVTDVTFPVLISAMDPAHDREVQKYAIASLATAASRMRDRGQTIDNPEVVKAIIAATDESDSTIRQLATYSLGLFESPAAEKRLGVLLQSGDELTRVNAAIALARHGSTAGLPIFKQILENAGHSATDATSQVSASDPANPDAIDAIEFERHLTLTNTLKAIGELSRQFDAQTRNRLITLLTPIAADHADSQIRVDAQSLISRLEG